MRILIFTILLAAMVLPGCAAMDNPFSPKANNPEEVTYSQFSDIPVPKDLVPDANRSFINYARDGSKIGLETLEGKIDPLPLSRAMINNMARDGWTLRWTASGVSRHMQLYERDNRYVVLYYYGQTLNNVLEVWVGSKLADGVQPPASNFPVYNQPSSGPAASPSGNVQERNLP